MLGLQWKRELGFGRPLVNIESMYTSLAATKFTSLSSGRASFLAPGRFSPIGAQTSQAGHPQSHLEYEHRAHHGELLVEKLVPSHCPDYYEMRLTFYKLTLSGLSEAITTEEQHSALSTLVQNHCGLGLGQSSQSTKLPVTLLLAEMSQLVENLLHPRPHGLQLSTRLGKSMPHHRLVHECLAESFTLETVGERSRESDTSLAGDANRNDEALVVEVGHDDTHAIAFSANNVRHGHLDIVKLDVRGSTSDLTRDLEAAHGDTGLTLQRNNKYGKTTSARSTRAHSHGSIVGPNAVGDPKKSSVGVRKSLAE